jgi:hypothetical protein
MPSYNSYLTLTSGGTPPTAYLDGETYKELGLLDAGANRIAYLIDITGGIIAGSLNGAPIETDTITLVGADFIGVSVAQTNVLEKIEFFSLNDYTAADLPTLSA